MDGTESVQNSPPHPSGTTRLIKNEELFGTTDKCSLSILYILIRDCSWPGVHPISSLTNCLEKQIDELNDIICCQNGKINELNKKLECYEAVVCERNSLLNLRENLNEWKDKIGNDQMRLILEQVETCKTLKEELNKTKTSELQWKAKCNELANQNNCLTSQLKVVKCHETELQCQLADCEGVTMCLKKDLCTTQMALQKANMLIDSLKTDLNCCEKELCNTRRQLDECQKECSCLNKTICNLEKELKCTKSKLNDLKLCAAHAAEKCHLEIQSLSTELKTKCKELACLKEKYNDVTCKLNEEKCKVKDLAKTLCEVKDTLSREIRDLCKNIQQLKMENCSKEDEICCLKNKIKVLKNENQCNHSQINEQKNRLGDYECKLKQMESLPLKVCNLERKLETCENMAARTNSCVVSNSCSVPVTSFSNECCISKNVKSIIQKYHSTNKNESNRKSSCNRTGKYNVRFDVEDMKRSAGLSSFTKKPCCSNKTYCYKKAF